MYRVWPYFRRSCPIESKVGSIESSRRGESGEMTKLNFCCIFVHCALLVVMSKSKASGGYASLKLSKNSRVKTDEGTLNYQNALRSLEEEQVLELKRS